MHVIVASELAVDVAIGEIFTAGVSQFASDVAECFLDVNRPSGRGSKWRPSTW